MIHSTLLKNGQHAVSKWKNGNGMTFEIAISPEGADFSKDPFLWRISSAVCDRGGPFSSFEGYERYLTLIDGKKFNLKFTRTGHETPVEYGKVFDFSGDDGVTMELPDGPVKDLGLVYRRDAVSAGFHVLEFKSKPRSIAAEGRTTFVICMRGRLHASIYPGETKFKLTPLDAIRIDCGRNEEASILLEPSGNCAACVIEIE